MIEMLGYGSNLVGLGRNAELHRYARWEFGTSDGAWLLTGVRRAHRRARAELGIARRVRYWLNSFRGFAAFDVRGTDGRE